MNIVMVLYDKAANYVKFHVKYLSDLFDLVFFL